MNENEKDLLEKLLKFYEFALHQRDVYEDGHGRRVAILAMQLAFKLNLPDEFLIPLNYGARFHDVGKLLVPVGLLNKEILTPDELDTIKEHVTNGFMLFQRLGINGSMLRSIAESHENWDGSGYPLKKKGEDIFIGARIIRIVDSYDAITSIRPYGKRMLQAETLIEMERCANHYDPKMLIAFKEMMT
jgi:HD-GYP domain-containing protein (c-di-GMP phosphodiesterase class II)